MLYLPGVSLCRHLEGRRRVKAGQWWGSMELVGQKEKSHYIKSEQPQDIGRKASVKRLLNGSG